MNLPDCGACLERNTLTVFRTLHHGDENAEDNSAWCQCTACQHTCLVKNGRVVRRGSAPIIVPPEAQERERQQQILIREALRHHRRAST